MTKILFAALSALPLLAAPALAVTAMPKVKAPVECLGEASADCATVIQVGMRVRF